MAGSLVAKRAASTVDWMASEKVALTAGAMVGARDGH